MEKANASVEVVPGMNIVIQELAFQYAETCTYVERLSLYCG